MTLFYIILSTFTVSLIAFIGILAFFKKKENYQNLLRTVISLAAGVLLAVTFTDLLPEAVESGIDVHNIFLTVLLSFLVFFILERFLHWHHCHCDHHGHGQERHKQNIVWINLLGDGLHNIMDGFLLATAFMIDPWFGLVTTVAVALHEIPQEIADFGVLLYGGLSKAKALWFNFLFALTSVLAGVAFYYFGQNFEHLIPYFAAFAAGNFIYLAAADLIPELHHDHEKKSIVKHTVWLLVGVGLIFIITSALPHSHGDEHDHEHNNEIHEEIHKDHEHDEDEHALLNFIFHIPTAQAQEESTSTTIVLNATSSIPVDGVDVLYNKITEFDTDFDGATDRLSYFLNDSLMLTTYDTNFDLVADLWLVYDENGNIRKEVMDTNGDEQFDLIISMDEQGQVIDVEGLNIEPEVLGEQYVVADDQVENTNKKAENDIQLFGNPDVKYWWGGFIILIIAVLIIWRKRR